MPAEATSRQIAQGAQGFTRQENEPGTRKGLILTNICFIRSGGIMGRSLADTLKMPFLNRFDKLWIFAGLLWLISFLNYPPQARELSRIMVLDYHTVCNYLWVLRKANWITRPSRFGGWFLMSGGEHFLDLFNNPPLRGEAMDLLETVIGKLME